MEERLATKIELFELKLKEGVTEMTGYARKDEEKTAMYRNELEIYVNQIHSDFQAMEQKRMKDMGAQLDLIVKLKDENIALKKRVLNQEINQHELKAYLAHYNETQTSNRLTTKRRNNQSIDDSIFGQETSMHQSIIQDIVAEEKADTTNRTIP